MKRWRALNMIRISNPFAIYVCVIFFSSSSWFHCTMCTNRCYNRILRLSDRQFSQLNTANNTVKKKKTTPSRFSALGKGKLLHDLVKQNCWYLLLKAETLIDDLLRNPPLSHRAMNIRSFFPLSSLE